MNLLRRDGEAGQQWDKVVGQVCGELVVGFGRDGKRGRGEDMRAVWCAESEVVLGGERVKGAEEGGGEVVEVGFGDGHDGFASTEACTKVYLFSSLAHRNSSHGLVVDMCLSRSDIGQTPLIAGR